MNRKIEWLFLSFSALTLLGWLYYKSVQIDAEIHVQTVQKFEQLREQDARLNQYVLQARQGLLQNYDPLVSTQQEIKSTLSILENGKSDISKNEKSNSEVALQNYKDALEKKFDFIESFKSHNAVLKNSSHYLPIAARIEYEKFSKDRSKEILLHSLLENILLFDRSTSDQDRKNIEDTIDKIQKTSLKELESIKSLLRHVNIILEHKKEIDRLTLLITQANTSTLADQFFSSYNEDFSQRDWQTRQYKKAMAILAAAMIFYVGWLLIHLQRARRTLADSLRELEFQKYALDKHSIVSITDRRGQILYTNEKFSEVSLYSADELLGKDHKILNSGQHSPTFFKDMWATIGRGHVWQGEILNRRKDGTLYWVDSTIAPFMDAQGKPSRYVSIRTDITAHKESEAILQVARNEAEEARKTADEARHAAETASKIKGDFLANMSHEIRTPMNGIIGMTSLALQTELTQEQSEFLNMIKSSADSLLQIINDILDFSKIESGKFDIDRTEFNLEAMLHETIKSLAPRAHEKNLELLLDIAPDVPAQTLGDPGRLRQVLINLIGNSIKFTHLGEVELSVTRMTLPHKMNPHLRFMVRDTGIGIPSEKFTTIFESFSQADTTTTRKYGGTGLGLSISTQIIQLMGGKIDLTSEIGKGSTFFFTIEMPDRSGLTVLQQYKQSPHLRELPILIADGNQKNCRILESTLRSWNAFPVICSSGEDALAKIKESQLSQKPFGLIILGSQMSEMNGLELAERVSSQIDQKTPFLIMLSSHAEQIDVAKFKSLGISDFIIKPVAPSELHRSIMTVLGDSSTNTPKHSAKFSQPQATQQLNILLAEDNRVNQLLATKLLEKVGHKVTIAENGIQALEHLHHGNFDVILMDVDMPEMNGYEATLQIRKNASPQKNCIPIIAMTAHAMKGAREECLRHGMTGYLSKPIDLENLWSELAAIQPKAFT